MLNAKAKAAAEIYEYENIIIIIIDIIDLANRKTTKETNESKSN